SGHRTRNGLVVAEISVALVLLVGAGLMVRSLRRLMEVDPGFQAQHVLTARVYLPAATYKDTPAVVPFLSNFIERVASQPGVKAAGAVSLLPVSDQGASGSTAIESTRAQHLLSSHLFTHAPYLEAHRRFTAAPYFDALEIPLLHGRYFTDADNEN